MVKSRSNSPFAFKTSSNRVSASRRFIESFPKISSIVASKPSTVWRDAAKTTPIANNDPIRCVVQAQAGCMFGDLTTTNDTTAPAFSKGGMNGRDCFVFTAPGDFLRHQLATGTPVGDFTIFMVCSLTSPASASDKCLFYSGETTGHDNTNNQVFMRASQVSTVNRLVVGGNGNWHDPGLMVGTPIVIALKYGTGNQDLRIESATTVVNNNASLGPAPPGSPRSLRTMVFGQRGDGIAWEWLDGKVAEFHWIPQILAPADHLKFIASLKVENGIG